MNEDLHKINYKSNPIEFIKNNSHSEDPRIKRLVREAKNQLTYFELCQVQPMGGEITNKD